MAKPSTRQALLRLLKSCGSQTAGELAEALGVSAVAVRKYLDALEREGALSIALVHQPMGRPAYRYSLTEAADGHFPQGHRELLGREVECSATMLDGAPACVYEIPLTSSEQSTGR